MFDDFTWPEAFVTEPQFQAKVFPLWQICKELSCYKGFHDIHFFSYTKKNSPRGERSIFSKNCFVEPIDFNTLEEISEYIWNLLSEQYINGSLR